MVSDIIWAAIIAIIPSSILVGITFWYARMQRRMLNLIQRTHEVKYERARKLTLLRDYCPSLFLYGNSIREIFRDERDNSELVRKIQPYTQGILEYIKKMKEYISKLDKETQAAIERTKTAYLLTEIYTTVLAHQNERHKDLLEISNMVSSVQEEIDKELERITLD